MIVLLFFLLIPLTAMAQDILDILPVYECQIADYVPNSQPQWLDIPIVSQEIVAGIVGQPIVYARFGVQVFESQIDESRKVFFEIDVPLVQQGYFVARVFQVRIRGKIEDIYGEWSEPSDYCACVYIPAVNPAIRVGTK